MRESLNLRAVAIRLGEIERNDLDCVYVPRSVLVLAVKALRLKPDTVDGKVAGVVIFNCLNGRKPYDDEIDNLDDLYEHAIDDEEEERRTSRKLARR